MASPLTVKVHTLVVFNIVDSYERQSKKGATEDKALGPSVYNLSHCEQFHNYFSQLVCGFSIRREQPPIILLTLDVNFTVGSKGSFSVRAFLRFEYGLQKQSHARVFQPLPV